MSLTGHRRLLAGLSLLLCLLVLPLLAAGLPARAAAEPLAPAAAPPDPTADIDWSSSGTGVAAVQSAFNNARTVENRQLGTHLPALTLPSQATWSAMSDGQRALWLINRERVDRGLLPMYGLDANVSSVAQAYAQYMIDHNQFSHTADGHDPGWRLSQNPTIGRCMSGWLENIGAAWGGGGPNPLFVERNIYTFIYDDGSCCGWGHRHNVLITNLYTNGPAGGKGLLGIGRAGGPYMGASYGEVVVMDAINPCPSWVYPMLPRRFFLPGLRH